MTARNLAQRRLEPEAMDDPAVDPLLHRDALEKLGQFNFLAGCAGTVGAELARLGSRGTALRVLDLATGGGDLPRRLMRRAAREGLPWTVDGADVSSNAVLHAREASAGLPAQQRPSFFELNVLLDPMPVGYDVLTCSLFLHHLSESDAIALLAKMRAAAKRAIIVQDLVRSPAALRLAWLATRLCSRNPLILEDGPASVAAAFTIDEVRELAKHADLDKARVHRRWPYRWVLTAQ
ncbi:MAG TPA: methyltransferase [Planctomycetota bacterium]|nr:methyltransferase [Planctomycetota bacterium]